jgi:ArsR family transcriptional regulator, arsenate/arsenite/antimonite-responsive transcriptional repressor
LQQLRLTPAIYFHYSGNVETTQAVTALSALAQPSRLAAFRLLVGAGPEGMPAGAIGEKLGLPPATLSFHLAGLTRAGLAQSRQDGRFVIYTANFESMNSLVAFLTENCCGGAECAPATT